MRRKNHTSTGAASRRRLLTAALGLTTCRAFAQPRPAAADARIEGPLKIVLPFGPGSGTDVYARMVAQHLGTALGVTALIENRPGANGVLAAEMVARAKPDGNTLLFTTNTTHAANPHLIKELRYDPVRDFAPISKMGNLTFFVLVPSSSPYHSLEELTAAARKAPKTISYGAANSFAIVSGSKLGKAASTEFVRVYYKSSPQIISDLIGGQIQFGFIGVPELALQASVGLNFRHQVWSASQDAANNVPASSSSDRASNIGTTVQSDPWALFTNNISAIYYFP